MELSSEFVAEKLRRWEKYLNNYRLPEWEDIPDFGLYMEQVLGVLGQYLDYMPPELKEEQFITPATINNYVRTKVMPEPRKKKYYRVHIAYLIIILTLKQSLSIALIQKILPMGLSEEEVRELYTAYVKRHSLMAHYFVQQVRAAAGPILRHENVSEIAADRPEELIVMSAIAAGFARLFAEKLLLLDRPEEAQGLAPGKVPSEKPKKGKHE